MYLRRQLTHASLVRDRPLLRRQGPHHRPARGGQDPDAAPGGSQTTQDRRWPYPRDHTLIPSVSRHLHRVIHSTTVQRSPPAHGQVSGCISPSTTLDGYYYDEVVFLLLKQQRRSSWKSSWIETRSSRACRWCRTSSSPGRPCRSWPTCCSRRTARPSRLTATDLEVGARVSVPARVAAQGGDHRLGAQARRDRQGAAGGRRHAQGR